MAKEKELTKAQAEAAGREARLHNEERIPPHGCEVGENADAWYVGYDKVDYSINVKENRVKPKQEFIFPGVSKDDPSRRELI